MGWAILPTEATRCPKHLPAWLPPVSYLRGWCKGKINLPRQARNPETSADTRQQSTSPHRLTRGKETCSKAMAASVGSAARVYSRTNTVAASNLPLVLYPSGAGMVASVQLLSRPGNRQPGSGTCIPAAHVPVGLQAKLPSVG